MSIGQVRQCFGMNFSRLAALVGCVAALGQALAQELTPKEIHAGLERFKITKDIAYAGTDHERQRLDMALPLKRRNNKPLPVIAYIHGGAWRAGSKDGGLNRLHGYLKTGQYAGVTIGYRLSQHAKWPAQIHDCKAAIRWIRANAKSTISMLTGLPSTAHRPGDTSSRCSARLPGSRRWMDRSARTPTSRRGCNV